MARVVVGLLAVVALLCAPASARAGVVTGVSVNNTNPSATQPAGSVPRQEFNTRTGGSQPQVDPNTQNKNTSQKK